MPDEALFIDLSALKFLVTVEDVLVSGPDHCTSLSPGDAAWYDDDRAVNIKVIQLIQGRGSMAWRSDEDAELGRQIGTLRHVCCTPVPTPDGSAPHFDGAHELWWPTRSAFQEGIAKAPRAWVDLIRRPVDAITLLVQAKRK